MTKNDLKLIENAMACYPCTWYEIDENAADTEEAREILHDRAVYLYHLEEAECGLL